MQRSVMSATLLGVEARLVEVEADIAGGLPTFQTVGLAEAAVREARVRVQAAIGNSGFRFPPGRISVNLAPAFTKKDGTGLDLPVAAAILAADGQLPPERLAGTLVLGELSLSGEVRPVRGALAAVEAARQGGIRRALVAPENAGEAALVSGVEVRIVRSFRDLGRYVRDREDAAAPMAQPSLFASADRTGPDLADVCGQPAARRVLEVAAAGGHHLLMIGSPGAGKTMLATRLPGVLPPLDEAEALEVTRIHSVAGLNIGGGLVRERPFRAPHHTTSPPGLVGGGSGSPRPGELSLAHRGVLFLDELPEFSRVALEVLRQPLESGEVTLARAGASVRFPAAVQLVAAMNPCPCGYLGDPRRRCTCPEWALSRYRARISGPLLDRFDLQVTVPPVEVAALEARTVGEGSSAVRARVLKARAKQAARLGRGRVNAVMTPSELASHADPSEPARRLLIRAVDALRLSARAWDRVLRVARTLADLDQAPGIDVDHVAEALTYRGSDRPVAVV